MQPSDAMWSIIEACWAQNREARPSARAVVVSLMELEDAHRTNIVDDLRALKALHLQLSTANYACLLLVYNTELAELSTRLRRFTGRNYIPSGAALDVLRIADWVR
jgi:hypothetical protein